MKNNNERYPEVYRIASEYALAMLGYEGHNMRPTEAFNLRRAIAKRLGWSADKIEQVWNNELRYALRFWDVSVADLMACNH